MAVAGAVGTGLRFHDLRHPYATWLVDDGVQPNMVQRVMGHEIVTTTLQVYTRRVRWRWPDGRRMFLGEEKSPLR